ncbi:MAG: response regulator [Steroidobacteraceae bacterium]
MSKRALVVDDSKSSRTFLARALAEQSVEVDAAETAEAAIDLLARSQPDVIFMDHLMPGMDGFQAMQAIKSNPRTAQIPILMYTSQEGELYLGQARALGAAGVLSKGAGVADVQAALRQLWPAPLPESAIVVTAPAGPPAAPEAAAPPSAAAAPVHLQAEQLQQEFAVLRGQLTAALDAYRTQSAAELRLLLEAARPAVAPPPPPQVQPDKPRHSAIPWLLALAAGSAAAILGTLYLQGGEQLRAVRAELADSKATVSLLTARLTLPAEVEAPLAAPAEPAAEAPAVAAPAAEPLPVPAPPAQ